MRWRPERIPADDRSELGLDKRERILAWTKDPRGRYLVATEAGLILQRAPSEYGRIGWEQIEQASFRDGHVYLEVDEGAPQTTSLAIPALDDIQLPIVVRDRVTASIVVNQHVPIDGKLGVRVVARRRPGDDRLVWRYWPDPKLEVDSRIEGLAEAAVSDVRAATGLD